MIELGSDHGRDRLLHAYWTPSSSVDGRVSWGTGYEGYSAQVRVVGDSLVGTANGWTDGGLKTGSLSVGGRRLECIAA